MRHIFALLAAAFVLSAPTFANANDNMATTMAGDLEISATWARAMLPGQPTGGGYLTITNKGGEPDRLVSVTSPAAARVEVHTMKIVNDVMTMRPVEGGLEIPPGETVELKPGGFHLMFMKVSDPFKEGGTVKVTLQFEQAGSVDVDLPVKPANGGGMKMDNMNETDGTDGMKMDNMKHD